jgi:hypothetical protein
MKKIFWAILFQIMLVSSAWADNASLLSMGTPIKATVFDSPQIFFQLYGGWDYSMLEDITNGTNSWLYYAKVFYPNVSTKGTGGQNNGIQAGAMLGFHLNACNSFAIEFSDVQTFDSDWSDNIGQGEKQVLTPMMTGYSLDYTLDVLREGDTRAYFTLGGGYYQATVKDSLNQGGGSSGGTFTANTWGGTFGFGSEIYLGGPFSLDVALKGRYAEFPKVSTNSATPWTGVGGNTRGPYSLALYNLNGYQVLVPLATSAIDNNGGMARYASLDYSGLDATVALHLYF